MDLSQGWNHLLENAKSISWQEWTSTFFQIISVRFAQKNNIWVFPTGIVGVLLAVYLYLFVANPPLYADGLLNVYYFIMSVYGWVCWNRKIAQSVAYPISFCSKNDWLLGFALFLVSWLSILFLLSHFTNSNTVWLDALVSSSALTAMWWMAKRKVENWLAWIASNLVAIPLNFYKGFILYALMYILFLALAWIGYLQWKKQTQSIS